MRRSQTRSVSAKSSRGGAFCGLTSSSSPVGLVRYRYAEERAPTDETWQRHRSAAVGRPLPTADSGGRGRRALRARRAAATAWTAPAADGRLVLLNRTPSYSIGQVRIAV